MIQKTNILFIISSPFFSGAEISALSLLKSLERDKYRLFLIVPANHALPVSDMRDVFISSLPLTWFVVSYNPFIWLRYIVNVIYCSFRICQIVRKNDIHVLYSNSVKSNVYTILSKLILRRKIVWHVRDVPRHNLFYYLSAYFSDKIICVSQFIKEKLDFKIGNKIVIYNGIDSSFLEDSVSLKRPIFLTAKNVVLVSQLTPWKNIEHYLEVANIVKNRVHDVRFFIAGDCLSQKDREYKAKILKKISEDGLDNVTFLGWKKNIKAVYKQMSVLMHTAIDEPFGRSVAEAMAMGKPVIAYNCGGPREIVVNDRTGYLVEPLNYVGLANRLVFLISSPDILSRFGQNGKQRIEEQFNHRDYVKAIEKIFDGFL